MTMSSILDVVMAIAARKQEEKPSVSAVIGDRVFSYELEVGVSPSQAKKLGLVGENPAVMVSTFFGTECQATAYLWTGNRKNHVRVSDMLAAELDLAVGCDVTIRAV